MILSRHTKGTTPLSDAVACPVMLWLIIPDRLSPSATIASKIAKEILQPLSSPLTYDRGLHAFGSPFDATSCIGNPGQLNRKIAINTPCSILQFFNLSLQPLQHPFVMGNRVLACLLITSRSFECVFVMVLSCYWLFGLWEPLYHRFSATSASSL